MLKSYPCLSFPAFFMLVFLLYFTGSSVVLAREASFYQKGLSPTASRLLFEMQELNRQGEYLKGLQSFEKFSAGRSKEPPVLLNFMAANLNFQLARYPEAVKLYSQVAAKAPEFDVVYENLGMALMLTESYQAAAVNLLKAAVLLPGKSQKFKYQAAIAYLYGEEFGKARGLLLELLAAVPAPPAQWLKALVQIHWRLAETKEALKVAARLVDSYPETLEYWRLYGQIALAAEAYQTALSAYKVLSADASISVSERKLIARIYQQLQLPEEAASAWERVFVEQEASAQELDTLVALYQRSGQIDKALEALGRLQKIAPEKYIALRRGKILYHAGRYREAYKIFVDLEKIVEDDGYQHLLAGYCAWNNNDFPAAAASWNRAASYPAWQERAHNLLRTLKPWLDLQNSG